MLYMLLMQHVVNPRRITESDRKRGQYLCVHASFVVDTEANRHLDSPGTFPPPL